jgi:DNA-binding XRE family transcriptional regulator
MNPQEYETTRKLVGTQQDAADRLGVTRQLISAREKGTARITEEAAIAIRELARTTKPRRSKRP